jgi:hypothetical protein
VKRSVARAPSGAMHGRFVCRLTGPTAPFMVAREDKG